ncbi:MAG: sugar ABC transporter ATP-binding protein [Rhodobacteraceae bacterium]|nr:MAG: sugar ABC transporter ATP-binding protein [Paracoccaceae bacterium]
MPGEVHALLGENGAGKSTLMKVLAGMYQPDEGQIIIAGQPVRMTTPIEAKAQGVVLIHQELSLVPEMSAAENIYLGELPVKSFGRVDWKTLEERSNAILKRLKCSFRAEMTVARLSIANQQMVEIARALTVEARVVIFDEPTASLTDAEKVVLFDIINDLKARGVGIIYISHRMDEIFTLSDRITVLRDGAYRGTLITADTTEDDVTRLMIGRSLDLSRDEEPPSFGKTMLEVRNLTCPGLFEDVSFTVRTGEVVGFYGLVGAGRTEIAETLFGLRKAASGEILVDGEAVDIVSPRAAIAMGISLVPENRKEQGLVLQMNCRDNMTLPQIQDLTAGPFVSHGAELAIFDQYRDRLAIKTPSWRQSAGVLSGGNQQKIVIGKWLSMQPRVLIVDEPTRGIDVGSKSEIHQLLRELAAQGYAVIVISSEMPEVLRVSDRIVAMYHGRIMREFEIADVTEDTLVQAISGIKSEKTP